MKWPWSYWEQDLFRPEYDLLIIGGGFSGLASAYFVKQLRPGWKVLVIDQNHFQRAASTRNAGFACISSLSELLEDVGEWGWDEVLRMVEWRWKGLRFIEKEFAHKEIDWKKVPSGEFFISNGQFQPTKYLDQLEEANQRLKDITGSDFYRLRRHGPDPLHMNAPFVEHAREGQLHPVKLYRSWIRRCLEQGVQIFERCQYLDHGSRSGGLLEVKTDQLPLVTKRILFCTNGQNIPLNENVKQLSNLVLVSRPFPLRLPDFNAHAEAGYIYTRNIDDRILIGGGRHVLAPDKQYPLSENNKAIVREFLLNIISEYLHLQADWKTEIEWEGIIGGGRPKMPIMRALDNNVFVLGRLSGMGVALSAYLGQKMAKIINRT